jgi:small subunit ribosomal protein S20
LKNFILTATSVDVIKAPCEITFIRDPFNNHAKGEQALANHKSAVKRNKQNAVRSARNTHLRSTLRTFVKQVRLAVAGGDSEAAQAALQRAIPYIDKAATKGVIHKATASRKISRLNKLVNTIQG